MADVAPLIRSLRVSARLSRKPKQKARALRVAASKASKAGSLALVSVEQHALLQDVGPPEVFRRRDRVLDLGGAGLGDPAAAAVAAAWVPLRKLGLERLHLGGNDISDAGLAALLAAMKAGPPSKLRRLNLRGNQLGSAAVEALVEVLPCLPSLCTAPKAAASPLRHEAHREETWPDDGCCNLFEANVSGRRTRYRGASGHPGESAIRAQIQLTFHGLQNAPRPCKGPSELAVTAAVAHTSAAWTSIWQQKGFVPDRLKRQLARKEALCEPLSQQPLATGQDPGRQRSAVEEAQQQIDKLLAWQARQRADHNVPARHKTAKGSFAMQDIVDLESIG
ncbi:hypothetical protein AK812_SmicGene22235 [Symbiodinium microadriaticum]|uniref:Protein NLRC3 n=1 Tax=Symbiodinium microadriaticum TaxID=2951 RepID=A0A1Q9DKF1_SYMMI|nr:hypothetical protein AK812_SmicGene22235 [Symbiodinium microadriaticum]